MNVIKYAAGGVAAALVLAHSAHAQTRSPSATELFHYQDPFGTWRTMQVGPGMAQRYYTAQKRDVPRRSDGCVRCPAPAVPAPDKTAAPRVESLRDHPGLQSLTQVIGKASRDSGVDHSLIGAVIAIESGFRKDARSPKGALGLMQLMPRTAAELVHASDIEAALVDPGINVGAGSRHLRRLIDKYPGKLELALAAYNAGEGAVARYDGIPPYRETQDYVRNVMVLYQAYGEGARQAAAIKPASMRAVRHAR